MGYLLDTSVAVHLREGEAWATTLLRELDQDAFLSAITRVELEGGIHARPELTERHRAAVRAMLTSLPVLDFDFEMAETSGAILETTGFSRRKIVDRMIAATALVEGLTLITTNGDDFRDVPGLEMVEWRK